MTKTTAKENGDYLAHSFNHTSHGQGHDKGLTKREYFAAIAMQGILSNIHYTESLKGNTTKPAEGEIGKFAVEMADELLKQLNNER